MESPDRSKPTLMTLPRELRHHILGYAIDLKFVPPLSASGEIATTCEKTSRHNGNAIKTMAALLLTSQQLRNEILAILPTSIRQAKFFVELDDNEYWLQSSALKIVIICLSHSAECVIEALEKEKTDIMRINPRAAQYYWGQGNSS
jgi:hypothetical protein